MIGRTPFVWTDERGPGDRPLCCKCRVHYGKSQVIEWEFRLSAVNVSCWICTDCWASLDDAQRDAHRQQWRPVA